MNRVPLTLYVLTLVPQLLFAQARPNGPSQIVPAAAQEVDVDPIRERYWAKGDESEMGVIQQRLYPKNQRFEIGIGEGIFEADPFLSVTTLSATLGFHFNELLSAHLVYAKPSVSTTSAALDLQLEGATINTNEPRDFLGLEGHLNFAHGKLATLGARMFYLDWNLVGGIGRLITESGNNLTYMVGVRQQLRMGSIVALNLDYRLFIYNETLVGKSGATFGQNLGDRTTLAHGVGLSLSFFLNFFD